jgi:hypothetical protein
MQVKNRLKMCQYRSLWTADLGPPKPPIGGNGSGSQSGEGATPPDEGRVFTSVQEREPGCSPSFRDNPLHGCNYGTS